MNTQYQRGYQLDLFRFLTAVSVMLSHYCYRGHAIDNLSDMDFPALAEIAQ